MREDVDVFNILTSIGAIMTHGHFEYSDGSHGTTYINHRAIFQNPKQTWSLVQMLGDRFRSDPPDVVIGPTRYGSILAHRIAEHLTFATFKNVMPLIASKHDPCMYCSRGIYFDEDTCENIHGKKVLIVDDIGKSGSTVWMIDALINKAGGDVSGIGYIANRGNLTKDSFPNVPHFESLFDFPMKSCEAFRCDPCKNKVPINTRFGHGRDEKHRTSEDETLCSHTIDSGLWITKA